MTINPNSLPFLKIAKLVKKDEDNNTAMQRKQHHNPAIILKCSNSPIYNLFLLCKSSSYIVYTKSFYLAAAQKDVPNYSSIFL